MRGELCECFGREEAGAVAISFEVNSDGEVFRGMVEVLHTGRDASDRYTLQSKRKSEYTFSYHDADKGRENGVYFCEVFCRGTVCVRRLYDPDFDVLFETSSLN